MRVKKITGPYNQRTRPLTGCLFEHPLHFHPDHTFAGQRLLRRCFGDDGAGARSEIIDISRKNNFGLDSSALQRWRFFSMEIASSRQFL
jgi:hypothetical protein